MISPHFPPDSSAGTHRVRILAPHLPAVGWEPVVLTVDSRDYSSRLDPALEALVPDTVRVDRVRALTAGRANVLGFRDLGLRALLPIRNAAARLFENERFDAVFITIYPSYTAVLGRDLSRRFGIPFVLDYQDPWVGAWGLDVGGAADGSPDLRSRVTRRLATVLEPWTLRAAAGVTAVSEGTFEEVRKRTPFAANIPFLALPIGVEVSDIRSPRVASSTHVDRNDGNVHVCYVGSILPHGVRAVQAVMEALVIVRARSPRLSERIRLHFFGTSNQSESDTFRVRGLADAAGVGDIVEELPGRLDYLDALAVQKAAHLLLLLGSDEPHYTPSKIYPALLTGNPLLAIYHPDSTARTVLREAAADRDVAFVEMGRGSAADALASAVAAAMERLIAPMLAAPQSERAIAAGTVVGLPRSAAHYAGDALAARLGRFLDDIVERSA